MWSKPFIESYVSLGFKNFSGTTAAAVKFMRALLSEIHPVAPSEFIHIGDSNREILSREEGKKDSDLHSAK